MADSHPNEFDAAQESFAHTSSISVDLIDPSPKNVRENFDEMALVRLTESIRTHGLLQPIVVRPRGNRFEIVAGESRYRAVSMLGWDAIDCSIRELSDVAAVEVGLLENIAREDLNPMERAAGLEMLISLGHSPETLSELLGTWTDAISNTLNLLSLPEWWQNRIRSGELSEVAAEYVTPWAEHPTLLKRLQTAAKSWPMPLTDWRAKINDAVLSMSKSMDATDPAGPLFEADAEDLAELEVVELRITPRLTLRRAMNCSLWEKLQQNAEIAASAADTSVEPSESNSRTTPANSSAGQSHNAAESELRPITAPPRNVTAAEVDDWRQKWLVRLIKNKLASAELIELEVYAEAIGIDIEAELRSTADEMRVPVAPDDDPILIPEMIVASL